MVNTIDSKLDHLLPSPYLTKLGDLGVPIIDCMIEGSTFYKTFYDISSSTNIMSKVTYKHLYNTRPMYRTYVQLQMADQSFRRPEGVVKDVMVKIRDHYIPTDFMVLDMGEEDDVHLILERPFLNTTSAIIYIRTREIHFQFPREKVRCYFNSYTTCEQPRKNERRHRSQRQKKQAIEEKEAAQEEAILKEEEKPKKSEPREETPQSKKVWKIKETSTSSSSSATLDEQPSSSSVKLEETSED
jgi:flagellar biosynthesis GTPase FlhF